MTYFRYSQGSTDFFLILLFSKLALTVNNGPTKVKVAKGHSLEYIAFTLDFAYRIIALFFKGHKRGLVKIVTKIFQHTVKLRLSSIWPSTKQWTNWSFFFFFFFKLFSHFFCEICWIFLVWKNFRFEYFCVDTPTQLELIIVGICLQKLVEFWNATHARFDTKI